MATATDGGVAPGDVYLTRLRALPAAAHGPRIEVRYDDLKLTVKVPEHVPDVPNIFTTLASLTWKAVTLGQVPGPQRDLRIIHGMRGVLPAGSSTLVLGAPGSGKSALLRVLAGRTAPDDPVSLTWNGQPLPALRAAGFSPLKVAAYAQQEDVQEHLLTVRETLRFVHEAAALPPPADAPAAVRAEYDGRVEAVIDMLGLRECADTIVGNDMKRGISGGQRKRVTIGEAVLAHARIILADEITNGLDASRAEAVVHSLVEWAHITGGTFVAALQAPTPEVLAAFDYVLLLSEGYELYHGPVSGLSAYLLSVGFAQPSFIDIADYAVTLATSPALARSYNRYAKRSGVTLPESMPAAKSAALGQHWRHTAHCTEMMAKPFVRTGIVVEDAALRVQYQGAPRSAFDYMRLLVGRQGVLLRRNMDVVAAKFNQSIVLAFILGSIYWDPNATSVATRFNTFTLKVALAMFAPVMISYTSSAEIAFSVLSKRVVYRQLDAQTYPALAYSFGVVVNHFPLAIFATSIFSLIFYFLVGYAPDAGRFFFYTLALITHDLGSSVLFRTLAYVAPNLELANAAANAGVGVLLCYAGFLITYDKITPWTWPLYYISPFSYTMLSISNNEFGDPSYGPVGPAALAAYGLRANEGWKWSGIIFTLGVYIGIGIFGSAAVLYYLRFPEPRGTQRLGDDVHAKSSTEVPRDPAGSPLPSSPREKSPLPDAPTPVAAAGDVSVNVILGRQSSTRMERHEGALDVVAVTLAFKDITYDVTLKGGATRRLLAGVSGVAAPMTMTALMGASGAGKTTLMDVLANRKTTGTIAGTVHMNGEIVSRAAFARVTGYVEQEDIHMPYQTVEEALHFSAQLRLESSVSRQARNDHVRSVLAMLELLPLRHRLVATLSPSERKRLTIGVELASNPSLLFLDEPTSGLDARSAAVVMKSINAIANTGRTVVCTIHQPSASVFFGFDRLLLLSPGGHMAYAGPIGPEASALVAYFEAIPGAGKIPPFTNPATWMLNVGTALEDGDKKKMHGVPSGLNLRELKDGDSPASTPAAAAATSPSAAADKPFLARVFDGHALKAANTAAVERGLVATGTTPLRFATPLAASFATQFAVLLARANANALRIPVFNPVRLFIGVVLALIFGLTWFKLDTSDIGGVLSKLAFVNTATTFLAIVSFQTAMPALFKQRPIFYRETAMWFYRPSVYAITFLIVEIPWAIVGAVPFQLIHYWMVGFVGDAGAFFTMLLSQVMSQLGLISLGTIFSALMPLQFLADAIGGLSIAIMITFSGVITPVTLMKGWSSWFYYSVGLAHSLRYGALPQFKLDQPDANVNGLFTPTGAPLPFGRYDFIVSRLGMTYERRWEAFGWHVFIYFILSTVAVLAWSYINHTKR